MSLVVLDTDLADKVVFITFVTLGELIKWTVIRDWGPRRLADLADWQQHIGVLFADEDVAISWGQLQARAQRRGRPRPFNDTWIAACCLVNRLPLATFNTKDFADFALHDGLDLLDLS